MFHLNRFLKGLGNFMNRAERRRQAKLKRKQNKKSKSLNTMMDGFFGIANGRPSPFPRFQGPKAFLVNGGFYLITSAPYIDKQTISIWENNEWEFAVSKVQGQLGFYTKTKHLCSEYFININLEPKENQVGFLNEIIDGESFMFTACLVDANTNTIKTFKVFTVSTQLCREIQNVFREQIENKVSAVMDYGKLDTVENTIQKSPFKEKVA
jgi:hypothetical protein